MTTTRLDSITHTAIEWAFYALFFIVPLILTPWNYELFEFNKMLTVYAITVIITTAWAIRMLGAKKWLITRTPFDIPILIFVSSQVLSTLFSINFRTSLLGYYSRFHGGLLSTLSYILLYYALVSNLNKKTVFNSLISLFTSAALVAFYAIAEHFGIDKNLWVQDVQSRVFSTLGQPNWLAAFLLTILPLTFAFILTQKKFSLVASHSALAIIFYLTLLFTKSRSGILGFALAYLVFWLLTLIRSILSKATFPWKHFLLITFSLLVISFFDTLRWIPQVNILYMKWDQRHAQTTGVNPIANPTATTSAAPTPPPVIGSQLESGGSESGDIRRVVWSGALKVWQHYPLFGSGVETFAYSYYNFRPPAHNLLSEWDFLYNKAHNEYLNFLATTGIIGLGSYLLLQAWVFIWLLKQLKTTSYLLPAFLSGLIGLSVSNFFGFSTVPVALLFFLYPAFAVVLTRHD